MELKVHEFKIPFISIVHRLQGTWFAGRVSPQLYLLKNGELSGSAYRINNEASREEIISSQESAYFETREECVANVLKHGHTIEE